MEKIAFKMKLKPGKKDEYIRRHYFIWPELKDILKKHRIKDYSIFLDEKTDTLFAVQIKSGDNDSQQLGSDEVVKKWWAYMADIMETNEDNSPVSNPLINVFHLD